mmetsp:Transcript_56113/g.126228  ORF Transcript_56113/g.126228 Transcript_56113/m.126228 type:complete len:348 (-) Transcript_56113:22-1065(-)
MVAELGKDIAMSGPDSGHTGQRIPLARPLSVSGKSSSASISVNLLAISDGDPLGPCVADRFDRLTISSAPENRSELGPEDGPLIGHDGISMSPLSPPWTKDGPMIGHSGISMPPLSPISPAWTEVGPWIGLNGVSGSPCPSPWSSPWSVWESMFSSSVGKFDMNTELAGSLESSGHTGNNSSSGVDEVILEELVALLVVDIVDRDVEVRLVSVLAEVVDVAVDVVEVNEKWVVGLLVLLCVVCVDEDVEVLVEVLDVHCLVLESMNMFGPKVSVVLTWPARTSISSPSVRKPHTRHLMSSSPLTSRSCTPFPLEEAVKASQGKSPQASLIEALKFACQSASASSSGQ